MITKNKTLNAVIVTVLKILFWLNIIFACATGIAYFHEPIGAVAFQVVFAFGLIAIVYFSLRELVDLLILDNYARRTEVEDLKTRVRRLEDECSQYNIEISRIKRVTSKEKTIKSIGFN